jgi:hypothetical protein
VPEGLRQAQTRALCNLPLNPLWIKKQIRAFIPDMQRYVPLNELKRERVSTMCQELRDTSKADILRKVQLQTQDQIRKHWRTMAELRRQQSRWK